MKSIYGQYVHEFVNKNGQTRYTIAAWNEDNGQYEYPMSKKERELTGCHTYVARSVKGIASFVGSYVSRSKALRRARYVFGENIN